MRWTWKTKVALGGAALWVAACGSSDDASADAQDVDASAETADAETSGEVAEDGTPAEDDGADPTDTTDAADVVEDAVDAADVAEDLPCTCTTATDCDDGESCNGVEQCVACRCVAGPPLEDGTPCTDSDNCTYSDACLGGTCVGVPNLCDDGNPCTYDNCNATTGACENPFVPPGSACDDSDPCTTSDACRFGRCSGECVPTCTWWPDLDADGWGDADASPTCAVTAPSRSAARGGDCCDTQVNVHPDQANYFSVPYTCGSASSWDYNCDSSVERRWTLLGECSMTLTGCSLVQEGWYGDTMPCGTAGPFVTGCSTATGVCAVGTTTMLTQMCR